MSNSLQNEWQCRGRCVVRVSLELHCLTQKVEVSHDNVTLTVEAHDTSLVWVFAGTHIVQAHSCTKSYSSPVLSCVACCGSLAVASLEACACINSRNIASMSPSRKLIFTVDRSRSETVSTEVCLHMMAAAVVVIDLRVWVGVVFDLV